MIIAQVASGDRPAREVGAYGASYPCGGGGGENADGPSSGWVIDAGEAVRTSRCGQVLVLGAITTRLQYGQATDCPPQSSSISMGC
jgi:hypothetical protein